MQVFNKLNNMILLRIRSFIVMIIVTKLSHNLYAR